MQRLVAHRIDRIITGSATSAVSVQEAFGLSSESIAVIHDGVDTDVFCPLEGVEPERGSVLFVGNSEDRNKGARYLLEALDMLKEELDFHVTFVDNVRWRLKLAPRLVRDFGLSSRVAFSGRVSREELVELYNRATLVVCPSLYEGFGLPAAEAMACGTPVLATTGAVFGVTQWKDGGDISHVDTTSTLGQLLFNDYVLPLEVASVLLLAAMIGAIVIARED